MALGCRGTAPSNKQFPPTRPLSRQSSHPLKSGSTSENPVKRSILSVQDCLDRGSVETARAILQHAIAVFPGKKSLYRALAHLERQHGTPEAVAEVLERGVKYCPQVRVSPYGLCPHSVNMVSPYVRFLAHIISTWPLLVVSAHILSVWSETCKHCSSALTRFTATHSSGIETSEVLAHGCISARAPSAGAPRQLQDKACATRYCSA